MKPGWFVCVAQAPFHTRFISEPVTVGCSLDTFKSESSDSLIHAKAKLSVSLFIKMEQNESFQTLKGFSDT